MNWLRCFLLNVFLFPLGVSAFAQDKPPEQDQAGFAQTVQPLLQKFCTDCHNVDNMESGIRVDHLDARFEDRQLPLWNGIARQLEAMAMPPEKEDQPTNEQRAFLMKWIEEQIHIARQRPAEKNGSVQRLTVAQYRNTLRDLLGLDDDLTEVLPPDAVSKDGFLNNSSEMQLSPLLIEAYFDIAEKALDRCLVDERAKPVVQNFRMDLGRAINPEPCPDELILGALSMLLRNEDFVVTELEPQKPFEYEPFRMRTKYDFIEGYRGNDTVRGWRKYDSIYHVVFACVRGNPGYPKGNAYETVREGLLLRPAIPSAELFQVESTYGPQANFKISLRELPDRGRFRVTVKAARYEDALLLDPGTKSLPETGFTVAGLGVPQVVEIPQAGVYQADVYLSTGASEDVTPDDSRLNEQLAGFWSFDESSVSSSGEKPLTGNLTDGAQFVDSPFGKALSVDGQSGAAVTQRGDVLDVGDGAFTVAAWINPDELRQGGIVCLGRYNYTHGWYFDMPSGNGVLRIETMNPDNQPNGTVASRPGVIRRHKWQHVAAIVRRGENQTKLYVNGYEVAAGTVNAANLDNPATNLHIGRIENGSLFKGDIDNVRIYRRALELAELQALIEPGRQFADPPPSEREQNLLLTFGMRHFSGVLKQPAFVAVRLPAGKLEVSAKYDGSTRLDRLVLTRLADGDALAQEFAAFEKRVPRVGVHVGLRRDCGSTLTPVGPAQNVPNAELIDYVFEDAISNYPSPDVEKDNVNYLAGIREIGVRSEFTDGRNMPRLMIRSVEFEGPLYDSWPPVTHHRIFFESNQRENRPVYAREVIRSFASRAFRRPVSEAEEASLMAVYDESLAATGDFQQSVKDALLVTLTSPQFLFLLEESSTPAVEWVGPYELASKLSYLLWNAAPDQRLRDLAEAGILRDELNSEVERLVSDRRFEQFTDEFVTQWLSLDKFDVVEIDRNRYPRLTRDAKSELRREPIAFVEYLIRNNLPVRNLIRSDFLIANEVVASYYGLGDRLESGFEFVPVRHGSESLGGLLTQAGILSGLSDGRESNPVKRGAWLARKIVAEPPADPPPNVPALDEDTTKLTLRERLEKHRNQPGCAKCHSGIDPWGLPFEQFDAGGLLNPSVTVDARSTLPDGTEVAGVNDLKQYLAHDRVDQVAFSVLKHFTTYAIGRSLTYHEMELLKEKAANWSDDEYRMLDLLKFVVNSEMFLEK